MRVIGGTAKGLRLEPVPGSGTRPISDRVKQALFDTLGDSVIGARVLDLFAGTGSVGIEALSRGADDVVFVESNPKAIGVIRNNLRRTGLVSRAQVRKTDVFRFLAGEPQAFDLVYVAPPQYRGLWSKTLLAVDASPRWLALDGLAIVQIFPKEHQPLDLDALVLVDERRYGSTLLATYQLAVNVSNRGQAS